MNSFEIIDPLAPESNKILISRAGSSIAPVFISPNSIGIRTSRSLIFFPLTLLETEFLAFCDWPVSFDLRLVKFNLDDNKKSK